MLNTMLLNSKNIRVRFKVNGKEKTKEYIIKGRKAQTLAWLVATGVRGLTVPDITPSGGIRLSEYIRQLRDDYLLDIVTHRETYKDTWHGRYELFSDVEIINISPTRKKPNSKANQPKE
jgi:hypothetical protein